MNTKPLPFVAHSRPRSRSRVMFAEAYECFIEALAILFEIEIPAWFFARWQRLKNGLVMELPATSNQLVPDTSREGNWFAFFVLVSLALMVFLVILWLKQTCFSTL